MQKNTLSQQQQLKQTAAQIVQMMRLLELSSANLEQEILKEVEENPALDVDNSVEIIEYESVEPEFENKLDEMEDYYDNDEYDSYDCHLSKYFPSKNDTYYTPISSSDSSMQEYLLKQLSEFELSEKDTQIAEYLIGCIDDVGYLSVDIQNIVLDFLLAFNLQITNEEVERVLREVIQEFEPAGVGARNIRECLILQLNLKEETPTVILAKQILSDYFEFFSKKQYDKLQNQLQVDNDSLKNAINEILNLNPYPVFLSSNFENKLNQITPDFIISIENGELVLNLNNYHIPKLKVNQEFKNQFSFHNPNLSKEKIMEAEQFIKVHVAQAKSFIGTLNLRELVLYNTMYAIMDKQRVYFLSGDDKDLKPMVLKDIATLLNLDISTVSRVSNSKYVQTPFGTISLKHLFSESIGSDDVSSKEVKSILTELIETEDKRKPLPDDVLCKKLKDKGYGIARRTIAKYREQMGIPVARLRKEI
ncbi:MAG: RNA polymerase factor sigma-54 [Bacteroidales bacterium]|jgi:RNA polymerase sigma-54 factor|nr:RNA polymerase factor sigma-54 [Bacteroidales bacterium]